MTTTVRFGTATTAHLRPDHTTAHLRPDRIAANFSTYLDRMF